MREPLLAHQLEQLAAIYAKCPGFAMHHQQQLILDALAALGSITPAEAEQHLGMRNAAAVVFELRQAGVIVHSEPCRYLDARGFARPTVTYTLGQEQDVA